MRIRFAGKNIDFTNAMKNVTEKKLERLCKYVVITDDTEVRVLARTYPHAQKVEITIPLKHGVLRTEQTGSDYYEALDLAVDVLERQLRKMKTRLIDRHREGLAQVFAEEEEKAEPLSILREKSVPLEAIDLEEAIIQMEMTGHNFYLFTEAESGSPCVIYRRNDGGYGVIRGIV